MPEYRSVANPFESAHLAKKTRRAHNITLVLDLDETLIYSAPEPGDGYDFVITMEDEGETAEV